MHAATDRVVLFDGVCTLCSAWVHFVLRFDRHQRFKLAAVQSPAGQAILTAHGLPTDTFDTMLLAEGPHIYTRSTAFLRVMRQLPLPWPLVCVVGLIPRVLRDKLYTHVARNRYRWFGRRDQCLVPSDRHAHRFLPDHAPAQTR